MNKKVSLSEEKLLCFPQLMLQKKGMQMAINMIILIVLGVLILIGLTYMVVNQFGFFNDNVGGTQTSSNVDSIVEGCNLLAESGQTYSYCCDAKTIKTSEGDEELSCSESTDASWSGGRILEMDCSSISC